MEIIYDDGEDILVQGWYTGTC